MKNYFTPPMIHWFSFIQQNTSTKSAIMAKPAKRNKKATLMQKKPANKISQGRVPSPNKQFFTSLNIGIREYV